MYEPCRVFGCSRGRSGSRLCRSGYSPSPAASAMIPPTLWQANPQPRPCLPIIDQSEPPASATTPAIVPGSRHSNVSGATLNRSDRHSIGVHHFPAFLLLRLSALADNMNWKHCSSHERRSKMGIHNWSRNMILVNLPPEVGRSRRTTDSHRDGA